MQHTKYIYEPRNATGYDVLAVCNKAALKYDNLLVAAAAVIGADLLGIEQQLPLSAPVTGNAYEAQDALPADRQFPGNLADAPRL